MLLALALTSTSLGRHGQITPQHMLDRTVQTYTWIPPDVSRPGALRATLDDALAQVGSATILLAVITPGRLYLARHGDGRVYHVQSSGQIDVIQPEPLAERSFAEGDSLLLCSSNLVEKLDELEIALALHANGPESAVRYFLKQDAVNKTDLPPGRRTLAAVVYGPERSILKGLTQARANAHSRAPSMVPSGKTATDSNTTIPQLTETELHAQPQTRWLVWVPQLIAGLRDSHRRGVALGLQEDDLMGRINVRQHGPKEPAEWHMDHQHIALRDKPEAAFEDVRASAAVFARTKLLEAPSHIRLALISAARPGAHVSAQELLRAMTNGTSENGGLRIEIGLATSKGMVHTNNEDCVCARVLDTHDTKSRTSPVLLAVADGMGGLQAGEIASARAISELTQAAQAHITHDFDQVQGQDPLAVTASMNCWIQTSVQAINTAIVVEAAKRKQDIGSTLAFALIVDGSAYFGSVGDSRIYLWRPSQMPHPLTRLVKDHSLVQALVDAGVVTDDQRYSHPERNVILRSLGDVRMGFSDEHAPVQLQPGDRLVVCSDGLWEMVRDEVIAALLAQAPNAQVACDRLVDLANANGGEDNVSVVIGAVL